MHKLIKEWFMPFKTHLMGIYFTHRKAVVGVLTKMKFLKSSMDGANMSFANWRMLISVLKSVVFLLKQSALE